MVVQQNTDFQALSSYLLDSKVHVESKIEKLGVLKDKDYLVDSNKKLQFLLDWICSTIDFQSKSDKLIAANIDQIKSLLSLLCAYLSKPWKLQCLLKLNLLEVLTKFCREDLSIGNDLVLCVWHDVLQYQVLKQPLALKLNLLVEVISYVADQIMKSDISERTIFVMFSLLSLYIKHIKSQYNFKKLFLQFCDKLFVKLLLVRCLLHNNSENICLSIDEIFKKVLLHRDHMNSLKMCRNRKHNEDENNDPVCKKKKLENDLYFKIFFEKMDSIEIKFQCYLLKFVPVLYKMFIVSFRKSNSASNLGYNEMFDLLKHFDFYCQIKNNMLIENRSLAVKCLEELLKVIAEYDIYQRVEDRSNSYPFYNWMVDMLHSTLLNFHNSKNENDQVSVLNTISLFLKIDHLVIESFLNQIWIFCLDEKSISATKEAELLLCELLTVYHKLHQLDKLMLTLTVNSHIKDILFPETFIEKYSIIISELELPQVCSLCDIFLQKLKQITTTSVKTEYFNLEIEAFLLCYLVIINATVVPVNGYMKPALKTFTEILHSLNNEAIRLQAMQIKNKKLQIKVCNTLLLVKYSVVGVQLLLQQYSLYSMETDLTLDVIKDNDSPIQKYIKACLLVFTLQNSGSTDQLIDLFNQYFTDKMCLDSYGLSSKYNVLKITEENLSIYLFRILEDNFSVFLKMNAKAIINRYTYASWLVHLSNNNNCLSLQVLEHYNNNEFQSSLINSIIESFNQNIAVKFVSELNLSENSYPKIDVYLLIQRLNCLPLNYFTESNLLILSCLVLHILKQSNTKTNIACLDCLQTIVGNILVLSYNKSTVAFHEILEHGLKFSLSLEKHESWENEVLFFDTLFHAVIKFSNKDNTSNADIIKTICSSLDALNFKMFVILENLFQLMATLLSDPLITSRSEQVVYLYLANIGKHVVNYLKKSDFENESILLFISLCKTVQIVQLKRAEKSPLIMLEDDLVDIFSHNACKLIKKLELKEFDLQVQQLELLQLLYSSPLEFTLRLRSMILSTECLFVSKLLSFKKPLEESILSQNSLELYTQKRNNLVSSIVLTADTQKMHTLLTLLSDAYVESLTNEEGSNIVLIWTIILKSKWSKEKKTVLWNFLPKVIMVSIHLLSKAHKCDQVVSSLKQLIAVVNITKNSLMSQYINCIFHVFPTLHFILKLLNNERFTEIFGLMFELVSQLLFNHQTVISSTVHSLLNCANDLLHNLINYINNDGKDDEDTNRCCEQMARLYREMGSHKSLICKYSPYLIVDYVKTTQVATINQKMKTCLDNGIFCIFDTCTEYEFSLLNVLLEKSEKENYIVLRRNFEKHHKYQGKA
ncbi:uncharacterized protein LOC100199846 [Hydra vulgaris]|uniref:uncharacterized protein LOC100199846 n=1 Tax=Hydra vulgaris TaxID=6087 RepID=UPI0032EA62E9